MKALLFILLPLVGWGGPVWGPENLAPKELLRWPRAVRDTGSMRPMIRGGEWLYYSQETAHVGDWVLLWRSDGLLVLHEVTAENKRAVYTSGVSGRYSDGWSLRSKVVGVVRYIVRPEPSHLRQVR